MSDVVVTLSGDEARLFRAQQRIIQQQMELEKGYTNAEKAAKKAAREAEADAKKQEDAQKKLTKAYEDQIAVLNEQAVTLTKGKAAAAEMKAIREGLSKEQAASIRQHQEELELIQQAVAKKKQDAADAKKAADEAEANVQKAKSDADKLEKAYTDQLKALDLQVVAIKEGAAAATEMKAIQDGLSQEQAATLRKRREEINAIEKATEEEKQLKDQADKLDRVFKQQLQSLERQSVEYRDGKAAAVELNAIHQGLSKEQAAILRAKTEEVESQKKLNTEGESTLLNLAKMAAGYFTINAAINAITASWTKYRDAQNEALQSLQGNAEADRGLTQVAETPADLQAMQNQADAAAMAFGTSRALAREVRFNARSDAFDKDFTSIMSAAQVVDPRAAATAAGKLPALFKGSITPMQAVSGALVAAEKSNLNFEDIAKSLPSAAEGAVMAGATAAETSAALSVLASRFKSGDTAADRIKAFGTAVAIDKGSKDEEYERS